MKAYSSPTTLKKIMLQDNETIFNKINRAHAFTHDDLDLAFHEEKRALLPFGTVGSGQTTVSQPLLWKNFSKFVGSPSMAKTLRDGLSKAKPGSAK